MKRFGMFGLLMAVMVSLNLFAFLWITRCNFILFCIQLLPIFVAPSDEAPDLEEAAEKIADGEDVSKMAEEKTSKETLLAYNKRMKDVLYDSFEYGMIP